MIFNSVEFAILFAVVLTVYWRLRHRQQNLWLLAASYLFYGWWDWRFLGLMVLSTVVDYTIGRAMPTSGRRGALLAISIAVNLSILGTFKYFDFFIGSADQLLQWFGSDQSMPTLRLILPLGISFYTFQTMSYTIDVYRGVLQPERNLLRFALFVSFFPQLVAGPIERATHLLPQVQLPRAFPGPDAIRSGCLLILLGLFKKVAIADALAPSVESVFSDAGTDSGLTLLVGVYAFAIQIYADFSGYTDIARGVARLLGFDLMQNFRQPYLSTSVTEFWHRWHISLSTWLRDYLYIPLGGNRSGPRRTTVNLMATMLLGGLWHGASWRFMVWGGLHGTYLAAERRRAGRRPPPAQPQALPSVGEAVQPNGGAELAPGSVAMALATREVRKDHDQDRTSVVRPLVSGLVTFHLVCLAWIMFRANSFGAAVDYLAGIVTMRGGGFIDLYVLAALIPAALAILVIDVTQRLGGDDTVMLRWPPLVRGAFYAVCLLGIVVYSGDPAQPFIYFQF